MCKSLFMVETYHYYVSYYNNNYIIWSMYVYNSCTYHWSDYALLRLIFYNYKTSIWKAPMCIIRDKLFGLWKSSKFINQINCLKLMYYKKFFELLPWIILCVYWLLYILLSIKVILSISNSSYEFDPTK